MRGLHDALKTRFPRVRELRELKASVKLSFEAESRIADEGKRIVGFTFESAGGLRVFQARLDGCTFNKLRPYEGWEPLRDEARELWAEYVRSASQSFAVVLETIDNPTSDGSRLPVILDIDAFRNVSTAGDLSRAWKDLEGLCHLKNRVFFDSLTDRARELFP